jgi:integrase
VKQRKAAPESDHVRALFDAADPEMKICIALAAYGSLRRGEICGLKYKDINGCMVSVHADMVEDADHNFVYKEIPKTSDSVRIVQIPQPIADLIGTGPAEGFIIQHNPTSITHRFVTLRNRLGIDMRFHDLRHYFASIGAVIGIPSTYLSDFGGWGRSSKVMQETYQNIFEADKKKYQDMMTEYFLSMIPESMS